MTLYLNNTKLTINDILPELALFPVNFPREYIPLLKIKNNVNSNKTETIQESKNLNTSIFFEERDIIKTFKLIESEEMAKLIGVFSHLSYWLVFGNINPIEIDNLTKKQMFVSLYEIISYFNAKTIVNFKKLINN